MPNTYNVQLAFSVLALFKKSSKRLVDGLG